MKNTVKDAVRMVGHLLETNSCTDAYARSGNNRAVGTLSPKACKWCLHGAVDVVSYTLKIPFISLLSAVAEQVGANNLVNKWEGSPYNIRHQPAVVAKLKGYGQ